jgi:hypothetical protein
MRNRTRIVKKKEKMENLGKNKMYTPEEEEAGCKNGAHGS